MSISFSGLIFAPDDPSSWSEKALLVAIGRETSSLHGTLSADEAMSRDLDGTALLSVGDRWLVFDSEIAFECDLETPAVSTADARLAALSEGGTVSLFYLDGISETYALSVFSGGARVGRRTMTPEGLLVNEGVAADDPAADSCEETRMLRFIDQQLGCWLVKILDDPSFVPSHYSAKSAAQRVT